MKTTLLGLLMIIGWITNVWSQSIVAGEYFLNQDPGVGQATSITVSNSNEPVALDFNVPVQTLSTGFHHLFVRLKTFHGNGVYQWGMTESRTFYVVQQPNVVAYPNLTAAEYFIDTDPGVGQATPISGVTSSETANLAFEIPLSTLVAGFHNLYIRFRNADGNWGISESRLFYILPAMTPQTVLQMVGAEYFIDSDPGMGQSIPLTIANPTDQLMAQEYAIMIPTLAYGLHYLYIRMKDQNNNWGFAERREFYINAPTCNLTVSNVVIQSVSCGQTNGRLTVQTTGGSGTLTYSLDGLNYQSSNVFDNLSGGTYRIFVKDASNCVVVQTDQVITSSNPIVNNVTIQNASCNQPNGRMTVQATGGSGALTYSKDGISYQSSNVFTNVATGTYTISVKDASGCVGTRNNNLVESMSPQVQVSSQQSSCGQSNGSLTAQGMGGVAPLSYALNNGTYQSSNLFNNLAAAVYRVSVKDANNCIVNSDNNRVENRGLMPQANFTFVRQNKTFTFTNTSTNLSSPTYEWQFGDGQTSTVANPTVTYAQAGDYTVQLVVKNDAGLCSHTTTQVLRRVPTEELQTVSLIVYPNPVEERLTVESPTALKAQIVNSLGQTVMMLSLTAEKNSIVISDLPNGIYWIQSAYQSVKFLKW